MKIQRNNPCPCLSGKKYKKCCQLQEPVVRFQPSGSMVLHDDDLFYDDLELDPEIELSPAEIEIECHNAVKYILDGDPNRAHTILRQLCSTYPDNATVKFVHGVYFLEKEDYPEAISHFEQAIKINPNFSEAYLHLSHSLMGEWRILEAINCLKRVIEIAGMDSEIGKEAQNNLNTIENIIKKVDGCTLDEFMHGIEMFDRGIACLKEKRYPLALELFQQVVIILPRHVQSYGNMAYIYGDILGNKQKAQECLNTAFSLDPDYEPALINLGIISTLQENEKVPGLTKEVAYHENDYQVKEI